MKNIIDDEHPVVNGLNKVFEVAAVPMNAT